MPKHPARGVGWNLGNPPLTMASLLAKGTAMKIGDRVQTHPATDAWIFGDRYGNVVKIGRKYVHVRVDRSGRTLKFTPDLLLPVDL